MRIPSTHQPLSPLPAPARPARADAAELSAGPVDLSTFSVSGTVSATCTPAMHVQTHATNCATQSWQTACTVSGQPLTTVLFLSDLDGTWLSPDPLHRQALDSGVVQLQEEARQQGVDLRFGYISARPLERIQAENLPAANYAVANNGAYIWTNDGVQQTLDSSWEQRKLQSGFRAERAFELANQLLKDPRYAGLRAQTVGEVVGSDGADACPDMAGFCFANESVRLGRGERAAHLDPEHFRAPRQVQQFAGELSRLLQKEGAEFSISPVYPFHGKPYVMFDLASVNKGDAIRRLSEREQVSPDHVIVAGDGGNDIAMMGDGRRAIVVGGNSALRKAAAELPHAILEDPSVDCSLGVLAGLKQHVAEIAREHRAG